MMTTDTIEGELTCCICLELFSDPVILPCSHNLCRQCALGLTHKGVLGPLEYILCPHCRNQSKLTALAENRTLANIVSIYKSNSQNIQSAKPCFVHRSRVQTFYCLTCKAPICNECTSVTSGLHRAHNFIDLESFFAETKVCCMSQLEQLESIQAKFMEKINLLMDCKHNMQVSSSKILTEAKHEVCRLELLLRSRWLQLETEYRADISKKLSVIDQSIDSGNTVLSSLNTLLKDYGISQSEPHNIQNILAVSNNLDKFLASVPSELEKVERGIALSDTENTCLSLRRLEFAINEMAWNGQLPATAAAETCEGAITVSESLPSVQSTLPQPSAVDEPAESSESKQSTSSETVLGQESCALPTSPFFRNYRVSSSDEVPSTRTRTRKPHLSVPTDNGSHRPALSSYNVRLQPARLLVPRSSSSVPWRWENAPSSSRSAASQHLNDGRSQSSLSCVFRHSTSSSVVPAASSSIDACRVHSSVTVTAAVSNNPTLVSSDIPHSAVASSATASVVEFTAASASSSAESMAEGQVETSCADDDSRVVQPSHASDNEAAQQPSDSMARQFSFGEYVGSFVIGTAASSSNPRNRMLRKKR